MNESQILAKSNFIIGLRNSISRNCEKLFFELESIGREDLAMKATGIEVTVNELVEQIHEMYKIKQDKNT